MTSKEDLGVICNYQESATPINPGSKIYYIDYTDNDEEYLRELKVKNRGLAIDAVLEDKTEEYNNREKIDTDNTSEYGSGSMLSSSVAGTQTMAVKVNSLTLSKPAKFKSYDDLWDLVMNHIDVNTQNTHPFMVNTYVTMGVNKTPNFTYTKDTTKTDSDNYEMMCRKLLTRVMMASNAIASTLTRRGPATTIIVGKSIYKYLESFYTIPNKALINKNILGNIQGGMTVVLSDKINPNKMIISRTESKQDGGGLMLLNDMNNYYLTETRRTFYKNFIWFDVIV